MIAFFAEGRSGMMIDGTWASGQLVATYPECNWQAEMVPELRNGVGTVLPFATGGGYAINANSKNPDKAAEVLNFLFTSWDRHYKSIREASYQPYPLKDFSIEQLQGMDSRLLYMYEVLEEAQENDMIGYCSWTFFPSETRIYMNENTDALFLNMTTVDEYLTKAQITIDQAIKNGTVPVFPK
jgi:raffinose/stachyose/melibiose transport system substrate-binding protein